MLELNKKDYLCHLLNFVVPFSSKIITFSMEFSLNLLENQSFSEVNNNFLYQLSHNMHINSQEQILFFYYRQVQSEY